MITKSGVLSVDGLTKSVVIREIEYRYGENPVVTVEVITNRHDDLFSRGIEMLEEIKRRRKSPIEKVIFNDPATIVIWEDGTKTVVKCQPNDEYNAEIGLAMCIAKKYLGNKGNFNEVFKKWIPEKPKVYKDSKNGGPEVGTKIKIINTRSGCYGAIGLIGIVTYEDHTEGLLSQNSGYNVKTEDGQIWRINPGAEIQILK